MFSTEESEYLRSQPLARFATVDSEGQPTVDAVGFRFDDEAGRFHVGGMNLAASRKYKNVAAGNHKVSLSVDDLASTDPSKPRGVRVHGEAEIVEREDSSGPTEYLEITPTVTWSWGIEERNDFREGKFTPKKTVWKKAAG